MDFTFKIGQRLPNGAVLLARTGDTVLALWNKGVGAAEFVTWRADQDGNTTLGHYFRTIGDAVADFNERSHG